MLWIAMVVAGAALGAVIGYFGRKVSNHWPEWVNWRRGIVLGAALGLLLAVVSERGGSALNESTNSIQRINADQFEQEVMQSSMPVVVDFYATWCGPCRILGPMLDQVAGSFTNQIKFVKVNIDEAPALTQKYQIQGVPTLLFFKEGKVEQSLVGLPSRGRLEQTLQAFVTTNRTGS